ncbi:MAG: cell division protein FtsA [Nitrospinota bacterium]|nr:MAG: cell division protein FtsA [Nitrospinota bacterium]
MVYKVAKKESIVLGLDIGTTKICAIVGEYGDDGVVEITGIGTCPSKGLRKGVVVNIESTVESIRHAVEEAQLMAGVHLDSVYVGIAGGHIKGFNSHGIIAIKNGEVTPADIERVVDAAKAVAMPVDREVIHILPQEFIIDDQDGIREPLGMAGVRLEAKVHIVTSAVTSTQNIVRCVNRAGFEVKDIILEQLASSEAVLTPDERELGVLLIDIGGGTTDVALFAEGSVRHTMVLAVGGNHITNDIAIGLRTPTTEAERLKKAYGCALSSLVREDETFEVMSVGGRGPRILSRKLLTEIIEPRVEEIFSLVQHELVKNDLGELATTGVVITGGASLMEGMVESAERVFELPVRQGVPIGIGGLIDIVNNPLYATGVGLVLYGLHSHQQERFRLTEESFFPRVFRRMGEWLTEYF